MVVKRIGPKSKAKPKEKRKTVRDTRTGKTKVPSPRTFITSSRGEGASATATTDRVDSPTRLLEDLVKNRLDPRDLTKPQRQAILLLQANGKHTAAELGELLKVSPQRIRKDLSDIRRRIGREVQEWTLEEVVGGMVMAAETYQARAVAQADMALAWSIERDKVKLLKELGVVGGPSQEGVRLTLEVLGAGYERARAQIGRALDPVLTGQVLEAEVVEPDPQPALTIDLPQRIAAVEEAPPAESPIDDGVEEVKNLGLDVELERVLDQEVQEAMEGPTLEALNGDILAAARAKALEVVTPLRGTALDRARREAKGMSSR